VTIALVLALSLVMVMAAPVAASPDLTEVSITVSPPTATATAQYQIDFFVHTGLTDAYNCVVVEFPTDTTVPPATVIAANVEIYDITAVSGPQLPSNVVVDSLVTKPGMAKRVRVYMPTAGIGTGIAAFHFGRVVFKLAAAIKNPPAVGVQTFCAWVYTDEEPNPVQTCYKIYETVPIDVYLKYQVPPVECGDIRYIPVGSFLTIGEALEFVDKLYTSGTTAIFTLKGAVTPNVYGTMTTGTWGDGSPIGDALWFKNITYTETESFTVTYNTNAGAQASTIISVPSGADLDTGKTGVVDVVSVTGASAGATPGYQTTFNLTGDIYNTAAGAYGNFGKTTAGWTDGTSIGEALTVTVGTNPTTNPETYKVTYNSDNATSGHIASLTIKKDGTKVWSPAAPTNVVDITAFSSEVKAWKWYDACPELGGLIGARVLVKDGTYKETFNIHTPGVMVESLNGAASTIIDATGLTPAGVPATMHIAAVMITAEGVTFGGTGKGFTVKNAGVGVDAGGTGPASTLWADDNSDGIADVTGVFIWPNGGAYSPQAPPGYNAWCRVNVIDNIIYGSQARGIRADDAIGKFDLNRVCVYVGENTVYDNLFDGFSGDGLANGPTWLDPGYTFVAHSDVWGYTAIVDNEFYQNGPSGMGTWEYQGNFTTVPGGWKDAGIEIGSTEVYNKAGTCYIVGNDIHDNVHAGINLLPNAAVDTLIIEENAIYDNGIFGIATSATTAVAGVINVTCKYNDIYGNGYWGIKNFVTTDFVAKENYWGALGGPSRGPAPIRHEEDQRSLLALGNGDAVSHYVYYNPWLSVSFATVLAEGVRYYGSDTLTLQTGWNTLSVPLALYGAADTLGEISTLGNFLTTANWAIAYQYDPASGWVTPTTLVPCRGYYIKMKAASRFPVLYSNSLGLPALALVPGWNLIGSAFGIDRTAAGEGEQGRWAVASPPTDAEAQMTVVLALASISGKASVVVSPSVPGQLVIWSGVYPCDSPSRLMYTGEGYWVFMTSSGTLAGFEITPLYLTP
jgi:hypothetical protein